jgi:hypothetical protein
MVSDLNKLAELVEMDSLPPWMRQEIESNRDEIIQSLQNKGNFVFRGPSGEEITIRAQTKVAAAA